MQEELAFYGGSFTALPVSRQDELLKAASPFLLRNPGNLIRISTRPDCIETVELGAQSMCDDVLLASRRGHTAHDVEEAATLIKGAGLLQMMTGLPCDTADKSLFTARRFVQLRPDGVRIYPTVVVLGTELYRMWRRREYIEHTVSQAVGLCNDLFHIFNDAGVPIIRMGLNPTEALSFGGAVAGAYHPAFGELVYSRIYFDTALALIREAAPGSDVTIAVARGCVSKMTGKRRCNIEALVKEFSLRSLKVVEAELRPGALIELIEIR
jgi:histone acetyltransferase (RNA polymerase elongator complex component)